MRTRIVVAALLLVTACRVMAVVEPNTTEDEVNAIRQARSADLWFEKWGFKMTRGLINVATCVVEIPRCVHVETVDNPVIGPLKGLFKGGGLMFVRAIGGAMDIATLGTVDDTYTVYDRYNFPFFVWQNWSRSER